MKTFVNIALAIILAGITILWGHQCVKEAEGESPYVDWWTMDIEMQCEQSLWLDTMARMRHDDVVSDLVNLYNASIALNSIYTDFDLYMRMGEDCEEATRESIQQLDASVISDDETREQVEAFRDKMLSLYGVSPSEVNQEEVSPYLYRDELYEWLGQRYSFTNYYRDDLQVLTEKLMEQYWQNDIVQDWDSLQSLRGDQSIEEELVERFRKSEDFDQRCIYAIELAHTCAQSQNPNKETYLEWMQELMMEKQYSMYLRELWIKWRCLTQLDYGSSRDSAIPNEDYNLMRRECAETILMHWAEHPTDWMALNQYFRLCSIPNIFREGIYPYGNQNTIELYEWFSERYKEEDETIIDEE